MTDTIVLVTPEEQTTTTLIRLAVIEERNFNLSKGRDEDLKELREIRKIVDSIKQKVDDYPDLEERLKSLEESRSEQRGWFKGVHAVWMVIGGFVTAMIIWLFNTVSGRKA